jgi:addiction module RelE/StbE family toxin
MRTIEQTGQFRRDYKREAKGPHRQTLQSDFVAIVTALTNDQPLAEKHRDHALTGDCPVVAQDKERNRMAGITDEDWLPGQAKTRLSGHRCTSLYSVMDGYQLLIVRLVVNSRWINRV